MIENRSSGINERSIRVFGQLFAHAMYITTVHTCTYVATRYRYTIRVYSMIVLQTNSQQAIMMMKLQ